MEFIVNLAGKIIALYDVEQKKVVALIENDYGLIRHILKILRSYELSTTKDGYLLFENKIGEVYLHRIIMEYYSRFNNKLFNKPNNNRGAIIADIDCKILYWKYLIKNTNINP